jgi:hypothetical protein
MTFVDTVDVYRADGYRLDFLGIFRSRFRFNRRLGLYSTTTIFETHPVLIFPLGHLLRRVAGLRGDSDVWQRPLRSSIRLLLARLASVRYSPVMPLQ